MIDGDKVLKGLEWVINDIEENGNINHAGQYLTEIKDALELLRKQPEQKHGHWIPYGCGFYRCSVCNDGKNMNFVPNYCSTCGAKMDGEGGAG